MTHEAGEKITFTAQRNCQLRGQRYRAQEEITVTLQRDWDDEEGIGEGGPWGWAGYTSKHIASLGN